ncbi:Cof-type HAD-IIB family hydrolase [Listeria sp. PSOL-1]|uniref:Cof-type HAD-IIB family hydrolase n=1 Tax=Listeria sp. PSOL-1 TaxID=1844999 RepID=UPI0013D75F77|nr:Cof-type HAD-IIB family hydrolase [Listeria sp. PSOL-1]
MIKVIASDMDGTLLNSAIRIAKENVNAIQYAREKGLHFVLCTGRMYDDAMSLAHQANLYAPAICMNGAEIRDEHGKIILQHPLEKQLVKKIFQVLNEHDMYTEFFTDIGPITLDKAYGKKFMTEMQQQFFPDAKKDEVIEKIEERFESKNVREINDISRLFSNQEITILKLISFSADKNKLKQASETLSASRDIAVTSSFSNNIEITHREAQKGISLQYYIEKMGVTLDETFAIGDNMNDLSMLKMAGYSVAMGNAEAEVKKEAKYHTSTNDDHGVAQAIYQMLKNNH